MEEPDVSLEPTFVAAADGRFEFVAALLAAGEVCGTDVAGFPAFIFAAVFAADFTVLFTVLWVDLAIDFVAAGVFLRAVTGLDSVPSVLPLDLVRDWAAVLAVLRFVTDLVTVAFMVPSACGNA